MKAEVFPSSLAGSITAPGSKSIAQRMAACALLAKGTTILRQYPDSDDCQTALNIVQQLGAIVVRNGSDVSIQGGFPNSFQAGIRNPKQEIDCGESGLAARMFTPIAALHNDWMEVKGHGTLLKRPFHEFEKLLPPLGCEVATNNGLLPLRVKGPLRAEEIEADGRLSSQFVTGLLMALPRAAGKSVMQVVQAVSIPYIQTTLDVLQKFGVVWNHEDYKKFEIDGPQNFQPQTMNVPGDWSGAAFILVAAAACADAHEVVVENLSNEITQADSQIVQALQLAGVHLIHADEKVRVRASHIRHFHFDATHCPDLFPPLCALAAFADGISTIVGTQRLLHKESNRAKALQDEFGKAGIRIVIRDNEMKIYPAPLRSTVINSHNDHRIAMAAAVLGMGGAKMAIRGAGCVAKSYPSFFKDLQAIGAKISIQQNVTA